MLRRLAKVDHETFHAGCSFLGSSSSWSAWGKSGGSPSPPIRRLRPAGGPIGASARLIPATTPILSQTMSVPAEG